LTGPTRTPATCSAGSSKDSAGHQRRRAAPRGTRPSRADQWSSRAGQQVRCLLPALYLAAQGILVSHRRPPAHDVAATARPAHHPPERRRHGGRRGHSAPRPSQHSCAPLRPDRREASRPGRSVAAPWRRSCSRIGPGRPPDRSVTGSRSRILVTTRPDLPDHSGHLQTVVDRASLGWTFVDLALTPNANRLAPLLAPRSVRSLSNLVSDLEPPYGIEP
jgi:hypothetical protein